MQRTIFLCLIVLATPNTAKNDSVSAELNEEDNALSEKSGWSMTPESGEGLSESERILVIALLVVLSLTNVILTICVVITCKKNARERNGTKIKTVNVQPRLLDDSKRDGVRLSRSRLNSRYYNTRQLPCNAYELKEYPTDGQTTDLDQTNRLAKSDQTQTPKYASQSPPQQNKNPQFQRSISMDPRVTSFQPSPSQAMNRQVSFTSLPGNMAAGDTRWDRKKSLREDRKAKESFGRSNSVNRNKPSKHVNGMQPPNLYRNAYL